MTEVKKTTSWGYVWEADGNKISASSDNMPLIYVTPKSVACFPIKHEDLESLYEVIGAALEELENLKKSPG